VLAVMAGFAGVALMLRPTIEQDQLWHGLMGLLSGVLSATAYLQVTALGRAGEPGERVVFYFSLSGIVAGAVLTAFMGGPPCAFAARRGLAADHRRAGHRGAVDDDPRLRHRRHAGHCALQYMGIVFGFAFGVLAVPRSGHADGADRHGLIIGAGVGASLLRSHTVKGDAGPTQT
jgi:hypothetical protein